jgi:hypothetical protein
MRLIWKKYDSEFNPVVTLVGLGFLVAGVYGFALLSDALRHALTWVLAVIPFLFAVMGVAPARVSTLENALAGEK